MGISLLKEASPKVKARIMAFGEIMLTRLAALFLEKSAIKTQWLDAREILTSVAQTHHNQEKLHLAADCNMDIDQLLIASLQQNQKSLFITQGFIAANENGETVLLGRGGSDVSAAYFAAKTNARLCEIWTDVPGIYTSNPHLIPEARLLKSLSYVEAQEIASMGAKVLHPRCIAPVKEIQIPLYIKYTQQPEREGTTVSLNPSGEAQIKSILIKNEVVLVSIEAVNMWQTAGFLAEIFDCFKTHGLSVDLISHAYPESLCNNVIAW